MAGAGRFFLTGMSLVVRVMEGCLVITTQSSSRLNEVLQQSDRLWPSRGWSWSRSYRGWRSGRSWRERVGLSSRVG
ncbi:hypothetical protein [Sodalis sp. RH16]|uniref:hypothetical protein n=1 Tax=Sodalis sp. RH16 TaxID=3394331 RepID=UPI0039B4200F